MFCFLNWAEQTHIYKEYLLPWKGHTFFCKHTRCCSMAHRQITKVSYKILPSLAHQACGTSDETHQVSTAAAWNESCKCVVCLQSSLQTPAQTCMSFSMAQTSPGHQAPASAVDRAPKDHRDVEGPEGNRCPKWAPKHLSAALAVILTYHVYMNILLFLHFFTFSKSISCVPSLNPGNKPHRGVGSFSITLPTAHHIGDPLSPCPDVIGKKRNKWQNLFHFQGLLCWMAPYSLSLLRLGATVISQHLKSIHLIPAWGRNVFYFPKNEKGSQKVVHFQVLVSGNITKCKQATFIILK